MKYVLKCMFSLKRRQIQELRNKIHTIAIKSHIRNAPIVASSWLSWISILIMWTGLLVTGAFDSINSTTYDEMGWDTRRTLSYKTHWILKNFIQNSLGRKLFPLQWWLNRIVQCNAETFPGSFLFSGFDPTYAEDHFVCSCARKQKGNTKSINLIIIICPPKHRIVWTHYCLSLFAKSL